MNQQQNDKFVTLSWICIHFFSIESFENILFWSMAKALFYCSFYRVRDIAKRMKLSHTFITWYLVKIAMAYAMQVITLRFTQNGS